LNHNSIFTILFVIPDGVGIKNYVYSNLLTECTAKAKIQFYTPLNTEAFSEIKSVDEIKIIPFTFDKESTITRFCNEAATYGRLLLNAKQTDNPTILTNWNYSPGGLKRKVLNFTAQKLGVWASKNYNRIIKLENIAQKNWSRSCIEKHKIQLQNCKPTSLFITHQRVASLMPICIAAKELGIPVTTVVYSWDNLPKARLAVLADKYFVWSDYMKEEMKLYYPEIPQQNVLVTGTPQFEFYLQENRVLSKQEFAKKHNLDATKKWICFSGDDIKTSPNDPNYLFDLAEAISKMAESSRPQIIFRRCPVDFTNRYDDVIDQFKELIIPIDPIWSVPKNNLSWGTYFPKQEDVDLQVNLAKHCEFVVNLGSTMAFDFAIMNKPCFYLNYDIINKNKCLPVHITYNFQHFKTMIDFDAVVWLNNKNELIEKVNLGLYHAASLAKHKQQWFQKVVQHPLDKASALIAEHLTKVS